MIAILLSVWFFRMSEGSARRLDDSAHKIETAVAGLDRLLGSLYSDTFSLLRDTMGDFRAHAWPQEAEAELSDVKADLDSRVAEKISLLREDIEERIGQLSESMHAGSTTPGGIETQVAQIVDVAVSRGSTVFSEARSETIRDVVLESFKALDDDGAISAGRLITDLLRSFNFAAVANELSQLRRSGMLTWNGDLSQESRIRLTI